MIDNEDLAAGKLKKKSIVRTHKTFWVDKTQCKKIGTLKTEVTDKILRLHEKYFVRNYYNFAHKHDPFEPGKSRIPYAGRVYDEKEMINLVDSALDFWLTAGRYAEKFEKDFAKFLGVKYCSLTNSGSSANLLAFMALTSPKLGDRRIEKGDEVITVAAGFPTTLAQIIQYGAIPVFVDVSLPTYNIDCDYLEAALSPRTKAVMLAHTLGNPFDINRVLAFCHKHNLWLIEDTCDALGSTYTLQPFNPSTLQPSFCGSFGHLSTFSFYPPHHITMGEGGAVCTNDAELKRLVESFRDWGRDCWCPPGKDNTCGKRFSQQLGDLPYGYDHKYVYSHFGYNLKVTDMQAAIGCGQLEKLPSFIDARKKNFKLLYEGLKDLEDRFILPEATPNSDPSWFGFLLTVREDAGFTRDEIVKHLEAHNIQTRMLFSGNIIKHPCFDEMRQSGNGFRTVSTTSPSRSFTDSPIPSSTDSPSPPLPLSTSALPATERILRDTF
ncbi:MAG: lipopolysaccharide biosynthesis protein RfbH, partial [Deltaproteobacteria bacterium]|nr:lipopolysaccharide biosynthesis protein RfbH [Deltaproteobacteria bacterium]